MIINSDRKKFYAYLLVFAQFACITYFLVEGRMLNNAISILILEVISIILGLIAIFYMRPRNLSVSPLPKQQALLIKSGPYHWIRHPMYSAVLLFCFARFLGIHTRFSLLILIILFVILMFKMSFEEKMLKEKFESYAEYIRETKRLIPFVY